MENEKSVIIQNPRRNDNQIMQRALNEVSHDFKLKAEYFIVMIISNIKIEKSVNARVIFNGKNAIFPTREGETSKQK